MCIAIPMVVDKVNGPMAMVKAGGIFQKVNIELVPMVKKGDYVLIHAGFAIQIIDKNSVQEGMKIWQEILSQIDD